MAKQSSLFTAPRVRPNLGESELLEASNLLPVTFDKFIFELSLTPKSRIDLKPSDIILFQKSDTNKYEKIKDCSCGCKVGLKLFEFTQVINISSLPPSFLELNFYIPNNSKRYIEEQTDVFYEIKGVMPNGTTNSPDVIDPPPSGTKNSSNTDVWATQRTQDHYYPINQAWINAINTNSKSPVVAIMDTGIDIRYFTEKSADGSPLMPNPFFPLHSYLPDTACEFNKKRDDENIIYGWNFVSDRSLIDPQNPFDDDAGHKHGTRIAKIIANETDNDVRIMPLKTANYKGESDFFDIFCAFEYIFSYNDRSLEVNRVRFINASWGYYGQKFDLFTHYIEKIKDLSIILITASGNNGDLINNINIDLGVEYYRYPAMYSKDFSSTVFTATTVNEDNISVENYGSDYVRFGIKGVSSNRLLPDGSTETVEGTFIPDPLADNGQRDNNYIKGSSYATAFLTGLFVKKDSRVNYLSRILGDVRDLMGWIADETPRNVINVQ
jgi:Subtilase family